MARNKKEAAIVCNFESGVEGDVIQVPSPLGFGEMLGRLIKVRDNGRFKIHTYELFIYGVKIGTAEAKQDGAYVEWRMIG